ncbi:DUF2000 domain-containing protein [Nucisporomicrobium flavum]|uniref:DUF2000 domain-containing protein n=1 Tax=Nucisporomicrobium flavum TaxID=2785915 RepID=UPI0018F52082|nr:DUF2000 domain-containing protein [Nucisporomicrobium flavum]
MSAIHQVGFEPEEIRTDEPTRSARLKWVIVVDEALPAGRAVNAAICVAAATATSVTGLIGPDAKDAGGSLHPGLPWAGCTVLGAPAAKLGEIRAKAVESLGVFVADMPTDGQSTRVYDEYLQRVGETATAELAYHAIGLVGPRNRIDKLVHRLSLLG